MELGALLTQAAAARPVDHALACLLGLLVLRVLDACAIDVEHLGTSEATARWPSLARGRKSP
jgi:hypothetical protein